MESASKHANTPSSKSSPFPAFAAWLRLLRAPNLFTVPGDPVSGYLLASGSAASPDLRLLFVALASLLFYAGGLIMNDLVDRPVDARERPHRPIVSGRVHPGAARVALLVCFISGVVLCSAAGRAVLIVALMLISAVTAYNLLHRSGPAASGLMGLCRGLNVLLGVVLAGAWGALAWSGVALITAYVSALTTLAGRELARAAEGWRAWIPAGVVALGWGLFVNLVELSREMGFRMSGAFFLALVLAGFAAWRLSGGARDDAPGGIGLLVSALIPLQVALCLGSGAGVWSVGFAFLLVLGWPLNRWLARHFAPS